MGKVLQEGAIWNLICLEKCAMKWGINITLRHLNISGLGDISHGISPGIHISARLTNGKHFSTHSKQFRTVHLHQILLSKINGFWKLTETIFAFGLRLSCHTTMKLERCVLYRAVTVLGFINGWGKWKKYSGKNLIHWNTSYMLSTAYVDIGYINGWGKQKYTWTTNHLEWYLEYFVEDVWSPVRQIKAEEDNSSSSCGNVGPGRWNSYILQHVWILNLESNCLFL